MTASATARASELLESSGSWNRVLSALRDEGYTKIDSIRATVQVLEKPLSEAKQLVHQSDVWADRRTADDLFQERLLDAAASEPSMR